MSPQTYKVTADSGQTKWPAPVSDNSSAGTKTATATLALKEIGATITVSLTMPKNELTTVTLHPPTGIKPPDAQTQTALGADVVFKDIPFGTAWTATAASKTYATAAPHSFDVTNTDNTKNTFPLKLS